MVQAGLTPVSDPELLQQLNQPQNLTAVDPTTAKLLDQAGGWSLTNSPLGGFFRGLRDPVDQGAAILSRGIAAIAPEALQPWARGQAQNVADINRGAERDYVENWRGGAPPSFDVGRMAGNIAATAPIAYAMPGAAAPSLAARMASGAASGAASGTLQPAEGQDFWGQTLQNAATGGAFGATVPAIFGALSRLVSPNAAERAAPLMDAGVRPTPGQILGGTPGRIEEALSSWPVAGDFIRAGRSRALQQFDAGAINDVLAPIGQKLESGKIGRDAIIEMGDKVRDAYQAAVPQAGGVLDPQALQDLQKLRGMAQFMPADRAQQFDNILKGTVFDKLAPNGGMTGQSFKDAESDLGKMASQYIGNHSSTSDELQLGGAIRELQSTLRSWLGRVNPGASADIGAANSAYARMLRVENAALRPGADPGTFSAAQLLAAVKKFTGDRAFSRGEGLMQPYAEAGKSVLGSKVPDSGTPFRSAVELLGTGLLGGALGGHIAPGVSEAALGLTGAGIGTGLMYSPLGQTALAHLLASRPAMAAPAAQAIRNLAPAGSAAAPWAFGALAAP